MIWQQKGWPYLTWNNKELSYVLGEVRNRQGRLAGKTGLLGMDIKKEALLNAMANDIIKSCELEGKLLGENRVRASVASHLKMHWPNPPVKDPLIEQTVKVMIDALSNYRQPVTEERIFKWKEAFGAAGKDQPDETDDRKAPIHTNGNMYGAFDSLQIAEEFRRFIKWIDIV